MIATRRSLGSFLSFALVFSATKSADIRPNWRPLGWARNTYLRLRFSSTAEEMQVVIHMNFLSCSTRAAAGTHSADEIGRASCRERGWLTGGDCSAEEE